MQTSQRAIADGGGASGEVTTAWPPGGGSAAGGAPGAAPGAAEVEVAGGDGNPLGARALYLGKTLYRIHGTNQPSTIGTFVSSGCIRLTNDDVTDLYTRVKVGTRVVVLPGKPPATTAAAPSAPSAAPPPGGQAVVTSPLAPPPTAMAR